MLKILSSLFALLITVSCALGAASDYKVDNLGQIYGYSLRIRDTDSSHYLIFRAGSNLTADRTFTITTGDTDINLSFPLSVGIGGTGLVTIPAGYIPFGAGVSPLASSAKLTWNDTTNKIQFYKDAGHYMTIDHKEIYVRSGDLSINSNYISTPLGYGFLGLGTTADMTVSLWVSNRTKGSGEQVSGYFSTTFSNDADYPNAVYGIWIAPILDTSSVYTSTAIGLKISDFSVVTPPAVSYLHGININKLTAGELGNYQITLGDASGWYESSYTAGTQTGNLRFILPVTKGTPGQALVTDGGSPANLSFSSLYLNADDYNFTPQAPGGSVTAGVEKTATLTPCPYGVIDKIVGGTASDHYVKISGGTGTAEAVRITGGTCTSGASSGTIIFTSIYSHSGAWTVSSATAGIQEAHGALPGGELEGGIISISPGNNDLWSPASIRKAGTQVIGTGYTYPAVGTDSGWDDGYPGHENTVGSRIRIVNNLGCTAAGTPWECCTGNRVGTCPNPQAAFRIVNGLGVKFSRLDITGEYRMFGKTHMTFTTGSHEPTVGQSIYGQTSGSEIVVYQFVLYDNNLCNNIADPWECCSGPKTGSCSAGTWAGTAAGDLFFGVNSGNPIDGEHFHESAGGAGNLVLISNSTLQDHRNYAFVVNTYTGHCVPGDCVAATKCAGGSDGHDCGTTRLLNIEDLSVYSVRGGFIRSSSNYEAATPLNYGYTSDNASASIGSLNDIGHITRVHSRGTGDINMDLSGFIDYTFTDMFVGGSNGYNELVRLYYSGRLTFTGGIYDFAGGSGFNIMGQVNDIKLSNLEIESCGGDCIRIVGDGTGNARARNIYMSNIVVQSGGGGYAACTASGVPYPCCTGAGAGNCSGVYIGDYADHIYISNSEIGNSTFVGATQYQKNGILVAGSTPNNIFLSNNNLIGNTTYAISLTNSNTAAYINLSNNNLSGYAVPVNLAYQYTNLKGATNASVVDFTLSYEAVAVSSRSIAFYEMWGAWITVSSNYTLTLPSATVGLNGCFEALTGATFVLTPASGENFVLNGTAKAANATISSPATAGNYVCIHSSVAGTWRTAGMNGTFTSP